MEDTRVVSAPEEQLFFCDRCHCRAGTKWIDYYWVCSYCAWLYIWELRLEQIR
jgi:hypothetical protein